MTSLAVSEQTKQLTKYCETLDQIIDSDFQPPLAAEREKSLYKWVKLMHTLLNQMHRTSPPPGASGESHLVGNLWPLLMYDIHETLDQLESLPLPDSYHRKPRDINSLFDRVQFHAAAAELLSCYFERDGARHQPLDYGRTVQNGKKFEEDNASIRAWVQKSFKNKKPDTLLETATARTEDRKVVTISMTGQDWPVPRDSVLNFMMKALRRGMREAAPGFPDADVKLSIRLAIFALDELREELNILDTTYWNVACAMRIVTAVYRCAWIVFGLTTLSQISNMHQDIRSVVGLVMEHTITMLDNFERAKSRTLPPESATSFKCIITDPLSIAHWGLSHIPSIDSLTGASNTPSSRDRHEHQIRGRYLPSSSSSQQGPIQTDQKGIDQEQPRGAELELGCGPIDLNVSSFDTLKPSADRVWFPARLRVFVDKSGAQPKFRVLICRDSSLISDYTVEPASDKVVLNYGSSTNPPEIWFQRLDGSKSLGFSPRAGNMESLGDLVEFQALFTDETDLTHYPNIVSLAIESKKGPPLEYATSTIQIWRSEAARRSSDSSSQHPFSYKSATEQSTTASTLLVFTRFSIFVVPVVGQITWERNPSAPSTLYLAANTSDKWLSIYKVECNEQSSPNLTVSYSASAFQHLCTSSDMMLARIELRFPNLKMSEDFVDTLSRSRKDSIELARDEQNWRDFQRYPIIKTSSSIHRDPR